MIVEEGPLRSSSDFRMREAEAYPDLYQESAARKTADKAINILQGRCVGGGTTVNWTSSFRTPPSDARALGAGLRTRGLRRRRRSSRGSPAWRRGSSIAPWTLPPNANNAALARGAAVMKIPSAMIRRNVKGCADLGYCGLGCPINAKQSTLVATLPVALDRGATLLTRARADRLVHERDRVVALEGRGMDASGTAPGSRRFTVRARAFMSAAGAIGTPALLLRSKLPDPHALLGKRTFLHPVVVSAAAMPERIDGFAGAPQTVYSDHYLDTLPFDGPIGFKLEAPPIHPILAAITLPGHGRAHAEFMRGFANLHVQLALLRDGFHPESPGGTVRLRDDGTPVLDYPVTPYVWEGVRRAMHVMADLQFAAGATQVMPIQGDGTPFAQRRFGARGHRRLHPRAARHARSCRPTSWAAARWARTRAGRWCIRRAATTRSTTSTSPTPRCSRPPSAPIRSSPSSRRPRGWRRGSPRRSGPPPRRGADRLAISVTALGVRP